MLLGSLRKRISLTQVPSSSPDVLPAPARRDIPAASCDATKAQSHKRRFQEQLCAFCAFLWLIFSGDTSTFSHLLTHVKSTFRRSAEPFRYTIGSKGGTHMNDSFDGA